MNRKAVIILIISVFFSYGCKNNKRPEGVLNRTEFANLLVDIYTSEARLNAAPMTRDSAMKLFLPFEKSFLDRHHISDDVLQKTYQYYVDHPDEFEKAYDIVIDTLSLREQRPFMHVRP